MSETQTMTRSLDLAFRKFGEGWKRKTFKTEAAADRWLDANADDLAETRWATD